MMSKTKIKGTDKKPALKSLKEKRREKRDKKTSKSISSL